MRVSAFNSRSIALFVFVAAIVAALFFIPEIIKFQKGLSHDRKSVTPVVEKVSVAPEKSTTDSKIADVARPAAVAAAPVLSRTKAPSIVDRVMNYFKTDRGVTPAELRRSRDLANAGVPNSAPSRVAPISWEALRGSDSSVSMRKAHDDALALARALPAKFSDSTYALYAYAGGIKYVLGSADRAMSADKAFSFLVQLDRNVTAAFAAENVPTPEFNLWTQVSLGPVFARSASLANKSFQQRPFNPKLRIVAVRVIQPGTSTLKFIESAKAHLRLAGVVEGQDIKRVEVYRNGERLKDRTIQRPDRVGRRFFFIRGEEARGNYVIRVVDKGGQSYTKTYNFYNRARQFAWLPRKSGRFAIPYGDFDPRIDGFFLIRGAERRVSPGVSFFNSSVGNGFSRF
jgi:hypothetical protein